MRVLILLYILADAASKEVELKVAEAEMDGLPEVLGQQEVKAIDAQRIPEIATGCLCMCACACVCVCVYKHTIFVCVCARKQATDWRLSSRWCR